jgi:hypothetical protein
LRWLLSDDNWRKKGKLGRRYVSEHHEHGAVIDRHIKIYEELLG